MRWLTTITVPEGAHAAKAEDGDASSCRMQYCTSRVVQAHTGLSGIHTLSDRLDAFAARMRLAQSAASTIA